MVYHLGMPSDLEPRYTLTDLASLAGVTPRTIRYYVSQGLLAVEVTPGPGPKYDDGHLARLRLIKRLQREHLPLAEIRSRLEGLDYTAILALSTEPEPAPPSDSALDYIRRITGGHAVAEAPAPALYAMAIPGPTEPAAPAPPTDPRPSPPERSQWDRIELAPDIELHIRRPLARSTSRQIDKLISIARDLLREEN